MENANRVNVSQENSVRVKPKTANANPASSRMDNDPASNHHKKVSNRVSNVVVASNPTNDSRTNHHAVNNRRMVNRRTSNSPVSSQDNNKAIHHSEDNNPANVSRDRLNNGNLKTVSSQDNNPVSNRINKANQVSNLKTASASQDNHNRGNVANDTLSVCPTTTRRTGLSSLKVVRIPSSRRSLAKIF